MPGASRRRTRARIRPRPRQSGRPPRPPAAPRKGVSYIMFAVIKTVYMCIYTHVYILCVYIYIYICIERM